MTARSFRYQMCETACSTRPYRPARKSVSPRSFQRFLGLITQLIDEAVLQHRRRWTKYRARATELNMRGLMRLVDSITRRWLEGTVGRRYGLRNLREKGWYDAEVFVARFSGGASRPLLGCRDRRPLS